MLSTDKIPYARLFSVTIHVLLVKCILHFFYFALRLEWESAVLRGASTFQALEEERLSNLKTVLSSYLHHSNDLGPRLIEVMDMTISFSLHYAEPFKFK